MKKIRVYMEKLYRDVGGLLLQPDKRGMELVQVAILIAIAIGIGLIFKSQITSFVNNTFSNLMDSGF